MPARCPVEGSFLYDKLLAFGEENVLPMHMPGHKRDTERFPWLKPLGGAYDITEIEGFDDLSAPHGVLAALTERLAAMWGSRRAFLSVNGSTGAIFAALSLAGENGVLAARNSHRSVFNAIDRLKLHAEYVMPRTVPGRSFFGSVAPEDVGRRLDETGCKAVVVTSPTYEGVVSDVRAIAKEAHARGAMLILDAAHGAHFGLCGAFPEGGAECGADIVVSSLHKMLPALTQTAVMHICSERADAEKAAAAMSAFSTSSPSYVLMASVDGMLSFLETDGEKTLRHLAADIAAFRLKAKSFRHLEVFDGEAENCPEIYKIDASKIYIDCTKCGFDGYALKRRLRREYGIEMECAYPGGALAYVAAGDGEESLGRLYDALYAVDRSCGDDRTAAESVRGEGALPAAGEKVYDIFEASRMACATVPVGGAAGRVCTESVWVYPPGVPVLLAGERVTEECADYIAAAAARGAEVASPSGVFGGTVKVAAE